MLKENIKLKLTKKNLQGVIGYSAEVGDVETVRSLKELYPDFDETLLVYAAIKKGDQKFSFDKKNPSYNLEKLILIALRSENEAAIKYLIDDQNINCVLRTVDLKIDNSGNYKKVEIYLTPLMYAVDQKCIKSVKALLKLGADINKGNDKGHNPFTLACEKKDILMMEYLILRGANTRIRVRDEESPFSYSIENSFSGTEMVELLIKSGLGKNTRNYKGECPLFLALRKNNSKIFKFLLENGFNPRYRNSDGKSVLDLSTPAMRKLIDDQKKID